MSPRIHVVLTLVGLILTAATIPTALAQTSPAARPIEITDEDVQEKRNLVNVPDGFDLELFAAPPEVNYPAAITATPDGNLFVAVDKNGSLDQEPGRGQILKVGDEDGDGRADHYTVFVDSVDSPRGLVYDGRRLYVMHPPTLTVYRDTDGVGVADTARDLVEGLGYGLDFRGADHTTNGMQMGIDGWLYIAVGDYGFAEAVGTDGSTIQSRTGAVVRVRPDGTELEIYASGLRNPYDVTLDPFLNGFERGNTNDGYGWRIRLQHIVPQAEYGYPSLFLHFADEVKRPLADYGGGSGAGALYVDAPSLPDSLGRALYTVDWGRSAVFRHRLTAEGASFEPTQHTFLQIPQPTDVTVDGAANLYVSSWLGASFTYTGEDVGFIARLTHEDASPSDVPEFDGAGEDRLVELLASPHQLHRRYAQRALLRREATPTLTAAVEELARGDAPREARVAALFTLKQMEGASSHDVLLDLAEDPALREFALRALADRIPQSENVSPEPFLEALDADDPRVRLQAVNGLTRMEAREHADAMLPLTADPDHTVAHVAVQSLAALEAVDPALDALEGGSPGLVDGAVRVLQRIHRPAAVSGLIRIYEESLDPYVSRAALRGLARLYHRPAAWNGESWWGTTPSPRGPYFEPVPWSESDRLGPMLRTALEESEGLEYRRRVQILEHNRAVPDGAGPLLLAAGRSSDSLRTVAVDVLVGHASVTDPMIDDLEQLARPRPGFRGAVTDLLLAQQDPPASSRTLLEEAVLSAELTPTVRARALEARVELGPDEPDHALIRLQSRLLESRSVPEPIGETVREFAGADARVEHVDRFADLARTGSEGERKLAYTVLLNVVNDEETEESARSRAREAVSGGWSSDEVVPTLLWAVGFTRTAGYEDQVRRYLSEDAPADAQRAARYTAGRLDL